ncbi:hydrolase 1, exosortase A system-associated [Sphingomonas cavernae]|uniref:Hydrolase 1, exosortase A system-associated n=1 Tax=Sphingomonas cavernae TaxID=2320861 RepID=A0A418WN65_9SPHN|nr:hydrolase 1, exosortase A system-associated [Sphingomonas cavernae]RJF91432.1 hydrolase 1, exosortase A system-associated [Sphingomonas cavernae]
MRQWLSVDCAGEKIAGILDSAQGETGLLIVSGGNEIASGSHAGMARLAARIAARGFPVFRFDRRGVGDSIAENRGYAASGDDMAAAACAFREAAPSLRRLVLLGNCDAATAIALFHTALGAHALILANPWVLDAETEVPPAAAIRARYTHRLRDPRQWLRAIRGDIDFAKLVKGLATLSAAPRESEIATQLRDALEASPLPARIILASRDATALAFAEHWHSASFSTLRANPRITIAEIDTASHSFARPADAAAFEAQVIAALEAASGEL